MEEKQITIYIATHQEKCNANHPFRDVIQVGAINSKEQLAEIRDDTGEHISDRNKSFCELTALYWIWKNSEQKIVGLEHYRRRFCCKDEWIKTLDEKSVIVPKPFFYRMSVQEEYEQAHSAVDFQCMLEVLHELYPEYDEAAKEVFQNKNKLYPYNMFIARKEWIDQYCEWLFPLLEEIEKRMQKEEKDAYQSRYIGFLAERLFTLYLSKSHVTIYESKVTSIDNNTICKKMKFYYVIYRNKLIYLFNRRCEGGRRDEQ